LDVDFHVELFGYRNDGFAQDLLISVMQNIFDDGTVDINAA
jgi:hypothetical protein